MSPPDDTPLAARLARASEWWFTPRWRALLTWLALSVIGSEAPNANGHWFEYVTQLQITYLNRFLPVPWVFNVFAGNLTFVLLVTWFKPLALRLNLQRGLAWIGLPMVAVILTDFLYSYLLGFPGQHSAWPGFAIRCGSAALQCCVLWGWRSRPWMCLLAHVSTLELPIYVLPPLNLPPWLYIAIRELVYAALLLYGTRLLSAEERASRDSGRDRPPA